ncbi:MAG: ABC transporter ATP-binding protein [Lewinellaceae bacterium]|nr:ABC transporter ATP-binding protein [Lewinellaceae bacterium]
MWLEVAGIHKAFGPEAVLTGVTFQLPQNEVLSILGRSGSGKTTLLRIMAGLEVADAGQISVAGARVDQWAPQQRNMVYLYQEALLFPHLNVFENVAFGLRLRQENSEDLKRKVTALLDELGLADQAGKMPEQLSGGQRQRVAFGRALIIEPRVMLLDEPFGALDTQTRGQMQELFRRIAREHRITALFVTHDLKEALLMGDAWGVLEEGRLVTYPNRAAFIADRSTGVQDEIRFWEELGHPGDAG